jgi:hypothetical protein
MALLALPSSIALGGPPTPTLSEHIKQRDWQAARQRLLSYPSDADYIPPKGQNQLTLLHLSCVYRAPVDVVVLVLDANPTALTMQDSVGCTPLHTAIAQGGSDDVVVLLIRRGGIVGVSVVSPLMGSPLSLACRHGVSIRVLKELLQSNAWMAAVATEHGTKPCQLLWYHFERNHPEIARLLNEDGAGAGHGGSRKRAREEISGNVATKELMERLRLLVDAIKESDQASFTRYHPSLSLLIWDIVENQQILGSMSKLLQIAVLEHPEELFMRDEATGNFVLHLAASMPRVPEPDHTRGRRFPLILLRVPKDTIDILVHEYPGAASVRNHQGHFPLHLALCEGRRTWRTGIASLAKASMEPLQRRERRTGLYPFQLAAMAAGHPCGQPPEEMLETIFQLLVACPHVLNCSNKRVARE